MDIREYLISISARGLENLFRAARALPGDKLDWKPGPGARSALDQLQEIATVMPIFVESMKAREVRFDPEKTAAWLAERAKITDLDELERLSREGVAMYHEFVRGLSDEDFEDPVKMDFPGEWKIADMANYHPWNMGYHEGQINYIASILAEADA